MLYLLDANVLIDANRDYYPMGRVPEFWEWLVREGEAGRIKIPVEIFEEVKEGTDDLAVWIKEDRVKQLLLLDVEADTALVSRAVEIGYATDLTDDEILRRIPKKAPDFSQGDEFGVGGDHICEAYVY